MGIRYWYIMFQGEKWIPSCRKVNKISFLHTAMCHNCTGLAWLQDSSQKKNQLSTYYYCEKGCRMLGLFFRRLFVLHLRNLNVFEVFRILIIQLKPRQIHSFINKPKFDNWFFFGLSVLYNLQRRFFFWFADLAEQF